MTRPRHIAIAAIVAAITLGAAGTAQADRNAGFGVTISPHVGIGVWVGGPRRPVEVRPPHREIVVRPHRRRIVRIGPPIPPPVIVRVPAPTPVVVPSVPPYDIDIATVTVWVTNSNGSRTAVKLTRRGGYYFGPRGECYSSLPTNEQLRMVYGF